MATITGTHKVDGANPTADRFVAYAYYYASRTISNADELAGSGNVGSDGSYSITVDNAGLHIVCIIDTAETLTKAPIAFEETAVE